MEEERVMELWRNTFVSQLQHRGSTAAARAAEQSTNGRAELLAKAQSSRLSRRITEPENMDFI